MYDGLWSEAALREDVGSESEGGLHVSFDFKFALHESGLGVKFAWEQVNSVVVNEGEGDVSFAFFAVLDGTVAVFEIDSPADGGFAFGGGHFHMNDCVDLLDSLSSVLLEERLDLVKDSSNLQTHI